MGAITYADKTTGSKFTSDNANEIKASVNDLYAGTNVVLNQTDDIQDASFSISTSGHVGGYGAEETFVSPHVTGHQGYTTDGTFHYLFHTDRIDKRNNDGTWSVALSNTSPFTGVSGTVNHVSDGDYYNGKLYVPIENWLGSCGTNSNQRIVLFNSTTLTFISQFDVSSSQPEGVSGIAIDGVNNIAYTVSYCDGTKIWKYNATTFAFLGVINLSHSISSNQGIAYNNGALYISSESDGVYSCDPSTGEVSFVMAPTSSMFFPEGIWAGPGELRWMIDNRGDGTDSCVHFFSLTTAPQGFYTDKSGTAYFGNKLNVGRKLQVCSSDTVGTLNIGSSQSTQIYLNSLSGVRSAVNHDDQNTGLLRNAYYNQGWVRPNVAKIALGFLLNESSSRFEFRSAIASPNPLSWITPLVINSSGKVIINNSTESVFDGTGSHAGEGTVLIKNNNSAAATGFGAVDNGGTRFMSVGVMNTASSLGGGYGLVGEGFVRSSTSATGLHFSVVTGPMRFSTNGGSEAMRIFQATRNISVGSGTDDAINKVQVNGSIKATQYNISALNNAPATATSTGTLGEIRITATAIYVCTATNTWVKATLSTF